MISINLNAIQEWERVRRDTEPHTSDVDRTPGTEQSDRPEIDDGSHGRRVTGPPQRRRREDDPTAQPDEDEAYEVDLGDDDEGLGAPPDGPRAPIESYQGTHVDEEA